MADDSPKSPEYKSAQQRYDELKVTPWAELLKIAERAGTSIAGMAPISGILAILNAERYGNGCIYRLNAQDQIVTDPKLKEAGVPTGPAITPVWENKTDSSPQVKGDEVIAGFDPASGGALVFAEGGKVSAYRPDPKHEAANIYTATDDDGAVRWAFSPEVVGQTEMAKWLLQKGLPEFLDHFLSKNADYGDEHLTGRGPAGEFIGVERKVGKLGKAVWEGQELNHEQPDEILRDLIGSCLIMLHQFAVGYNGKFARSE